MSTDVCVPISELAGAIQQAKETLEKNGLVGGILGHVGRRNFHVLLMVDPNDKEEVEKADEINESIVLYALKRGGTCRGTWRWYWKTEVSGRRTWGGIIRNGKNKESS